MKYLTLLSLLVLLILGAGGCVPATPAATGGESLILASTTSTQDSGLLDVLVPLFQEQTGYVVQTVAVGTGAALRMAREGNADVLLVHAPQAELELMADGYGKDRVLIMHNDFVLVGPEADSAEITTLDTAADAFAAIAASGSPFVTRGDESGTNKKELTIWQQTPFAPNDDKPIWYIESGQGMGRTLFIASEKQAYTMTDRATYLAQRDNLALDILLDGDADLLNIYHAITVNPEKWPNAKFSAARAFVDFLTAASTQAVIADFGVEAYGQPLFFPDAGKSEADLGLK